MYLSDLKVPYFYYLSSLSIMVISMGTTVTRAVGRARVVAVAVVVW